MVFLALIAGGKWGRVEICVEGRISLFRLPHIVAGASDLRHCRFIALLLRAWPFSVAPRPLGPTFRPRGYPKVLVLTSCRARGLCSPPGCPPLQNVQGSGSLRLGLGRRAPPWGRGGSPADAHSGERLRLPALRSWSRTAPFGGRSGRCPRWS